MKTLNVFAVSLLCHAQFSYATPTSIACPTSIDITETISLPPPSWDIVADHGLLPPSLISIAVYTGHPDESGSLVPDSTTKSTTMELTTWRLPPESAPYWMACNYANARILLAKQLPVEAKICYLTVALRNQKRNGVTSFVCE